MRIQALDIAGHAAGVTIWPEINGAGEEIMQRDRRGDGWKGALLVSINGGRADGLAFLTLTPSQARDLATKLDRQAAFAEARAKGEPGPCLCSAWSHNLYPCPNDAALDYMMCRECWTPEHGQQGLAMGHGEPGR